LDTSCSNNRNILKLWL